MPKPQVVLDYSRCDPALCEEGICVAARVCERKVLRQDQPGEMPDIYPSRCLGCVDCLEVCPTGAIRLRQ